MLICECRIYGTSFGMRLFVKNYLSIKMLLVPLALAFRLLSFKLKIVHVCRFDGASDV